MTRGSVIPAFVRNQERADQPMAVSSNIDGICPKRIDTFIRQVLGSNPNGHMKNKHSLYLEGLFLSFRLISRINIGL